MKHLDIQIYGRVQGINFRWYARRQARKLKINGYVKNLPDGSVLIEAEGEPVRLDELTAWCKKGPWFAKVERVEVVEREIFGYTEFEIKY